MNMTGLSLPRFLPGLLACCVLAACGADKPAGRQEGDKPQVGVLVVAPAAVPLTVELAGRVATRGVAEIRPQVGGILQKQLFAEGSLVKAGQVLYQIDPSTYEAAFRSAKASVEKAEATWKAAEITAKRNGNLARIDAVSQQTADDSRATADQDLAALEVAKAELETARINLEHTRITSPIAGRVDVSAVMPGALLTASQTTALTTVRQLDPLIVDVKQSSTELLRLRQELKAASQRKRGEAVPVQLVLEDDSVYARQGHLQFDGVAVDESSGMVTLRAEVPNPDGVLLPGMYVRARIQEGTLQDAILVPQESVTRRPSGDAITTVVGEDGRLAERKLVLGRAIGNQWLVTAGLKAGDRVVVEGLKKATLGDVVTPVPAHASAASSAAAPSAAASAGL
ncbi:efflux RND transporter periplasmic adaptor subunit [Uliginosibacterium paludis]|uniref:Efflux RND transporter periplasmic adaptor subunit n=1 Tax=Uliginosibacterium paludis TaxID=1615952 RepID=A0ABV2CM83_9RHOO